MEHPPPTTVIEALQRDMDRLGLNQEQLGEKLGISQQAVSAWFAEGRVPKMRLQQVADLVRELGDEPAVLPWLGYRNPVDAPMLSRRRDTPAQSRDLDGRTRNLVNSVVGNTVAQPGVVMASEEANPARRYELAFVEALPAELQKHHAALVNPIINPRQRADYASDRCVIEIVHTERRPFSPLVGNALLLELAVVRKLDEARNQRREMLLVLPNHHPGETGLQELMFKASLMDVTVLFGLSPQQLAETVKRIEAGGPVHVFDLKAAENASRY